MLRIFLEKKEKKGRREIPEGLIVRQNCSAPNQEGCRSYCREERRKEKEGRQTSKREENQGPRARRFQ